MLIRSTFKRYGLAALLLLCHCVVLLAIRNTEYRALASNLVILTNVAAAAVVCWFAGRRAKDSEKQFWRFVSSAFLFWAAGTVVWIYYESLAHKAIPTAGLTDILYLGYGAPLLLALFIRPSAHELTRAERTLETLQVFIVVAITYFSLVAAVRTLGSGLAADRYEVHVYNVQNSVIFALFALQAFTDRSRMRSLFRRFAWYLLVYGIGVTIWNYKSTYSGLESGTPYDLLFSIAFLFAVVLAQTWKPHVSRMQVRSSPKKSMLLNFSPLLVPFLPLLMIAAGEPEAGHHRIVLLGVGASFVCYAARLVLSQNRQAALVERLSASEESLKIGQRELQNSEQRYRAITENSSDAIVVVDEWSEIRYCNKATESMLGYRVEDLLGKNLMVLLPQRIREVEAKALSRYQRTGEKTRSWKNMEMSARHEDGSEVPLEVSLTEYWQNGERLFMACARTLAARKQAEEARRKSDERVRLISRATNDAVWDRDLQTDALWWGEGYTTLFGYPAEEIEPTLSSWTARIHPEDASRVIKGIKLFIDAGGQLWSDEYRFQRRDGSYVYIFDRGYVIRNDAGVPVRMIGAMADITERRNLSEQLRQAQKMEAVGQLAGGVAHDMNNMLMVISSYITLIEEQLKPSESVSRYLREVHKAADRGASFTSQLLAFSRKQVLMPEVLNLNDFIQDQISILRRLIGEDIELSFEPDAGSANVKFDRGQLAQVLMNLAANARDAMPMGGKLQVQTIEVNLDSGSLSEAAISKPGVHICLSVTDTGIGMTEQVRARIFEPFFTTKGRANGTGLGLATVYGIVKQSESAIDVVSAPGQGTTFNIYIPRCEAAAQKRKTENSSADLSGDETILLVEDEQGIRVAAAEYLESLGYKVLTAQDGVEAMRIARERTTIDLLISDVIMPRMSGQELVSRFRALYPHASALLISGYTDDLLKNHAVVAGGMGFLQKPFSLKHLTERVRHLLAQQPDREAESHTSAQISCTNRLQ